MCQHTSSLLNSHNATMQRCINNLHQKGQLSSTLDIPQLRQLEPFLERMTMACILWMEKGEVNWTDCLFMPQDLVEIQVEQPQKDTQSLRILMASGLRLTYMSKLDIQCHSKHGTFRCGNLLWHRLWYLWLGKIHSSYNDKQYEIWRVMHSIKIFYQSQITISESQWWFVKSLTVWTITFVNIFNIF